MKCYFRFAFLQKGVLSKCDFLINLTMSLASVKNAFKLSNLFKLVNGRPRAT